MRRNHDSAPAVPHRWLDPPLVVAAALMALLGLVNLVSIGEYAMALHQLSALLLGVLAMAPLARMRIASWWLFGRTVYVLAVALLLAAATTGAHAYGARRWLGLGVVVIQPSELAKVGLLLVLAHLLGAPSSRRRIAAALVLGLVPIGLTLIEPDLSTATLLGAMLIVLLVLGRVRWRLVAALLAASVLMAPLGERALRPYQLGRLHAFLGTGADPQAVWTALQAHIAVASGGLVGASSALPHQLLAQYLPARETDLAFASLVEQHGLVAGVAVLLVGAVLVARLVAAAREARTSAGSLVAAGLAALVGSELVVSVAGNLGLLPLAGVPCPLLSAGGTAAVAHLAALGIVIGGRRDAETRRLWRVPRWRRRHPRLARSLAAGVAVTLAATGFSAATLQGEGAGLRRTGVEQATRSIRLPAERGLIVDRHGVPLALPDPDVAVLAVPRLLRQVPRSVAILAGLLGRSSADIDGLLRANAGTTGTFTVRVADRVPAEVGARIDAARLPGVVVVHTASRRYPAGRLLGPLLGFVGVATPDDVRRLGPLPPEAVVGRSGLESEYNAELAGVDGAQQVFVDPLGRPVAMASMRPPVPGSTLRLSIDLGLQRAADAALAEALRGGRGRPPGDEGAAVVLDARSGEVLAMASLPAYDDNLFGPPVDTPALTRTLLAGGDPLLEHATQTSAPPGSTFKLVVAATDAATGVVPPDLVVPTGGALRYGGAVFRNWAWLPPQDLRRAIAWSNDVYFYKLALALGPERIAAVARALGVGERTGVDVPAEDGAYLGTPQSVARRGGTWYPGSTVILGIGQGAVTATPLQVARWTAAVASGVLVTPHLGLDAAGPMGTSAIATPAARPLPFAARLGPVRDGLRLAVVAGTGSQLRDLPVPAGGKTGTAEDPATPGGAPDAWFTGVVPADRPEIAVTVMVRGGGEGFDTAEPAAAAILRHYLAHRDAILAGVRPVTEPADTSTTPTPPVTAPAPRARAVPRLQTAGPPARRPTARRRR